MNGESVLLWLNMMSVPAKMSRMMIGASHQAFLSLRKDQVSPNNDLFLAIILLIFHTPI